MILYDPETRREAVHEKKEREREKQQLAVIIKRKSTELYF
jgi:hypothetical protein